MSAKRVRWTYFGAWFFVWLAVYASFPKHAPKGENLGGRRVDHFFNTFPVFWLALILAIICAAIWFFHGRPWGGRLRTTGRKYLLLRPLAAVASLGILGVIAVFEAQVPLLLPAIGGLCLALWLLSKVKRVVKRLVTS